MCIDFFGEKAIWVGDRFNSGLIDWVLLDFICIGTDFDVTLQAGRSMR